MKLFRISNILILIVAAFLGSLLFWTSQSVQEQEDRLYHLKSLSAQEEDALNVLAAEWDYLNRPQRLEELAKTHLSLDEGDDMPVLTDASLIAKPVIPPAPRVKPVSFQRPAPKKQEQSSPVIQQSDSRQFDALLKTLDGGAQ